MNLISDNTAFVHAGGGLGNLITNMVRGYASSKAYGLDGCCFWWRTKSPRVMDDTLDSILNLDLLGKELNSSISSMSNQQGWDFCHQEQIFIDTEFEREKRHTSLMAYRSGKAPNYFLVPLVIPLSRCRGIDFGSVYKKIQPSTELMDVVDSKASDLFSGRTLGVHVRRTDRWREARVSTDQAYFRIIDGIIDEYDSIFLATDEPSVEASFESRYGKKIVHTGKPKVQKWSGFKVRKDLVDLNFYKDAVVDMWLLSKCDQIIGSWRSSFSKVAARVSNNPSMKITIAR